MLSVNNYCTVIFITLAIIILTFLMWSRATAAFVQAVLFRRPGSVTFTGFLLLRLGSGSVCFDIVGTLEPDLVAYGRTMFAVLTNLFPLVKTHCAPMSSLSSLLGVTIQFVYL